MVNKTKAIYHTLNFFSMDVVKKFMIGECWIPCADIPEVQKVLADASVSDIIPQTGIFYICLL